MADQQHNFVEFIVTGKARMHEPMAGQPISNRNVLLRQMRCFRGEWTPWLPIGVFLIRHADGPILIDTGSSPECMKSGYFPKLGYIGSLMTQLDVKEDEGIVTQLEQQHGVKATDLQAIVLTHLHHDHAGGLEDIFKVAPNVPVYVSAEHWKAFGEHTSYASFQGCTPNRWPKNFKPTLLHFDGPAVGPWKGSSPITKDGVITAVHTPGHVPGHASVVVTDGPSTYFIAGDATYGVALLEREEPDGANSDPLTAFESLKVIKEFARQRDVIVLPSHDVDTPSLLKNKTIYKPADIASK